MLVPFTEWCFPILRMQSVAGAFSTDSPCNMQKPCCSLKALLVARALRAGSLSPRCLPGEAAPSNSHPLHRKTLHRDRRRNKCRFGPVLPALACFVAHRTTCSFLPTRDCYGLLRPSCSHVMTGFTLWQAPMVSRCTHVLRMCQSNCTSGCGASPVDGVNSDILPRDPIQPTPVCRTFLAPALRAVTRHVAAISTCCRARQHARYL